jgi:hypothetical protein
MADACVAGGGGGGTGITDFDGGAGGGVTEIVPAGVLITAGLAPVDDCTAPGTILLAAFIDKLTINNKKKRLSSFISNIFIVTTLS